MKNIIGTHFELNLFMATSIQSHGQSQKKWQKSVTLVPKNKHSGTIFYSRHSFPSA